MTRPTRNPEGPKRARADARRDRALGQLGWRVVRLAAAMVEQELDAAVALVAEAVAAR